MPRREKNKIHFIYKTTNLITGKFYVGMHSTNNLNDGYLGSGKILRYSLKKYGSENHKIERLEFFEDREKLIEKETEIVNESLLKDPLCMNLGLGGQGGILNKEHDKKFHAAGGKKVFQILSQRHSEKLKNDSEYREKYSQARKKVSGGEKNPFYQKTHTIETKNLMSKSQKLRLKDSSKNSMFGKCWVFNEQIKENKAIPKTELEKYQRMGWKKGRKNYTVLPEWPIGEVS